MKQLTLNYQIWRCGGDDDDDDESNRLGIGKTALCNDQGYMCCQQEWIEKKAKKTDVAVRRAVKEFYKRYNK